jgi:hypothetical protein
MVATPRQRIFAVTHQIERVTPPCIVERGITLDNSLPASEIFQLLQNLTNIVYLARLDAGDKVKVRNYMTDAERELERIKHLVGNFQLDQPPRIT